VKPLALRPGAGLRVQLGQPPGDLHQLGVLDGFPVWALAVPLHRLGTDASSNVATGQAGMAAKDAALDTKVASENPLPLREAAVNGVLNFSRQRRDETPQVGPGWSSTP
jgi:hypothetical protein